MRDRLVNARLMGLLTLLRRSADIGYRRAFPHGELNRRLLTLVGHYGGLSSIELVGMTGQEKAQISRAVAALSDQGLVERKKLRARIMLTPAGQHAYEEVMAVAYARDERLTAGLSPAELERFHATTRQLTERAALLLAQEQQAGEAEGESERLAEPSPIPERARHIDAVRRSRALVAPSIITLSSYITRSATIIYRRESGLSPFAWRILSQIGEHQPITLAWLIALLYRDRSQVGRAVKALEADGLVVRQAVRGRRDVLLNCTATGQAIYAQMCDIACDLDDFLFADMTPAEHRTYIQRIEALTVNAQALLDQEQHLQAAA